MLFLKFKTCINYKTFFLNCHLILNGFSFSLKKKAAVRDKNLYEIWFSLSFAQVAPKVRTSSVSELSQCKINYFSEFNWEPKLTNRFSFFLFLVLKF